MAYTFLTFIFLSNDCFGIVIKEYPVCVTRPHVSNFVLTIKYFDKMIQIDGKYAVYKLCDGFLHDWPLIAF